MRITETLMHDIERICGSRVAVSVPLSRLTSFRIGGPADLLAEPASARALADLMVFLRQRTVPRFLLGAGTNVLFPDAGFRGVVVRTRGLRHTSVASVEAERYRMTAEAGVPLTALIAKACRLDLTGMEALFGIPGTVGGAVAVNAGAGGVCAGDFIEEVRLVNGSGAPLTLTGPALDWGYRRMNLPAHAVVTESVFRMVPGDRARIRSALETTRRKRRSEQPWKEPSAGCVFKNPLPENPAGAIIDRLGLKGAKVGGAKVSEIHANFIVNCGTATASDVLALIETIQTRVIQAEGIELELEIQVVHGEADHE